jgi:hypothetical protein
MTRIWAILLFPLSLSSFTHIWNPVGFPDLFFDEGIYMRRAMHMEQTGNPQEAYFHDHPFFGQIFLAGVFYLTGYPGSIHPNSSIQSLESLYLVPRVIMGVLSVFDTLLIFMISLKKYNKRVAFIASSLFAVMPITWFTRRILLDSILLPFFLASILFALYSQRAEGKRKNWLFCLISGICMGLAIFTKIPIFTMIPLIGYLVYSGTDKKHLGIWFIPVILIPLLWPLQSFATGEFTLWAKDVLWQAGRPSDGILVIFRYLLTFDPVLLILGLVGFAYQFLRKDLFLILWLVPFLIFESIIGYVQYFHSIPIIPAFCIAIALIVDHLTTKFKIAKSPLLVKAVSVGGLLAFGFISTLLLITTDLTSSQFQAASYVMKLYDNTSSIVASPVYTWMYIYVYHMKHTFLDYLDVQFYPIETSKVILVSDDHFQKDKSTRIKLQTLDNESRTVATFKGNVINYSLNQYPYTSFNQNYEGSYLTIKQRTISPN